MENAYTTLFKLPYEDYVYHVVLQAGNYLLIETIPNQERPQPTSEIPLPPQPQQAPAPPLPNYKKTPQTTPIPRDSSRI